MNTSRYDTYISILWIALCSILLCCQYISLQSIKPQTQATYAMCEEIRLNLSLLTQPIQKDDHNKAFTPVINTHFLLFFLVLGP